MKQKLTFIIVLMLIIFGCSSEKETPEKDILEPAVSVEEAAAEGGQRERHGTGMGTDLANPDHAFRR